MAIKIKLARLAAAAFAIASVHSLAHGELVTAWIVHNGTSTVTNGGTNSPTFTAADDITVMAPFTPISLINDGDFVKVAATLTMNTRTGTGVNTLNTQLRIGLFNGPAGAPMANDQSNNGYIIEYTNLAAGGLIREQTNSPTNQTNPFTSPTNLGNGTQDSGADSIQGANPGPVLFELSLTRNAGKLDLSGKISGTDAVSGNPYLATYALTGLSSTNFPANSTSIFNRVALFLGPNVNAASAGLSDVVVQGIPESRFGMLAVALAAGVVMTGLQVRRASRRRVQAQP